MTGKDELGARFDERRPDNDSTDGTNHPEDSDNSTGVDNSAGVDNPNNTGGTDTTSSTGDKPGPDANPDSTRNRKQVPMYLSDERADALNGLYERLDGRSKVAGEGGIEKHADFMAEVADLAIEHEDELARRLGIEAE